MLIDNEEYKLETNKLTEKERQKIKGLLYNLQEEEKRIIQEIEKGQAVNKDYGRDDGWEHCPRYGSNRVKQKGRTDPAFSLWMVGLVFLLLGLILWPLLIVGVLLFLISPIGFLGAKTNICRDCKKNWIAN